MLSSSSIRYLLAIYELCGEGSAVRSVDIAASLQVTRASVAKSLKKLAEEGLIRKEYYGEVELTSLGVQEANHIYTEYVMLYVFFSQCMELPPETARCDAISALCHFTSECREALTQQALHTSAHSPVNDHSA